MKHLSTLRPLFFFLLLLVVQNVSAQFEFSYSNTNKKTGTYTDISSTGTPIAMTDNASGASVSAQNIGFNFFFNGVTYTQFMIHADGIMKFGTAAPGASTGIASSPQFLYSNVMTSTATSYQNILLPFFLDLVQGSATPEFHVLTDGIAPNRICTIQWKNLRDADNNVTSTTQHQFEHIEFQVKLYETSNKIEFVYGNWITSANAGITRASAIGIKATSTSFINDTKVFNHNNFAIGQLTDPAFTNLNRGVYFSKNSKPVSGTTYEFYGQKTTDINVSKLVISEFIPANTSVSKEIQAIIRNEGTTTISNATATINITGANTHTETINLPILAAGAIERISFTPFALPNKGIQQVEITVNTAGDENSENNTKTKNQNITSSYLAETNKNNKTSLGLGFNNTTATLAYKISSSGIKKISQIKAPFNSNQVTVNMKIYEDDGAGGSPGTLLYTSPSFITNSLNSANSSVNNIQVTGDYYIAYSQLSTTNMSFPLAFTYPHLLNHTYTSGNGISWTLSSHQYYSPFLEVSYENTNTDVGIESITSPLCEKGIVDVKANVRNFSNAVHDYSINPVTISGIIKDDRTNIDFPFSIVKNTGTIAAGGTDEVTILPNYDMSPKGLHSFNVYTSCVADEETNNDTLTYFITNRTTLNGPADSVCPNTVSNLIYNNTYLRAPYSWKLNDGTQLGTATTLSVQPTSTTAYYFSGVDNMGCTITDSIVVKVRSLGNPEAPVISFDDTLLSYKNDFKVTLSIPALAGHTIHWFSSGVPSGDGTSNVVEGFRGLNPEQHTAYYTRTSDGCSSLSGEIVSTKFGDGILISDATTTVCDTSIYDNGGALGAHNGQDFTKTYSPADPTKKLKLTIKDFAMGQFGRIYIYDGNNTGAPQIGRLDASTAAADKYEFTASNTNGELTIRFDASGTSAGFLGGFTCIEPLQFRTIASGNFNDKNIWESKSINATSYTPAERVPTKGDDTIIIYHNVVYNTSQPFDQLIIETTGYLQAMTTGASIQLQKTIPEPELTIKGNLYVDYNTYFGSTSTVINLEGGTIYNNNEIQADSIIIKQSANQATMFGSGTYTSINVNSSNGLQINSDVKIKNRLTLENGIVTINPSNYLSFIAGYNFQLFGGNSNNYIDGRVRWQTFIPSSGFLHLPFGNNGLYRPATFYPTQTSYDSYVEYEMQMRGTAPQSRTLPATLIGVNNTFHYTIDIINGHSYFTEAQLKLNYENGDGVTDAGKLRIAKSSGSTDWLDIGGVGSANVQGEILSDVFTSFSDFVLAYSNISLPLTLSSFNAERKENSSLLRWTTNNEKNVSHFEIQTSANTNDFKAIGNVNATNATSENSYSFTHSTPQKGINYYRLKINDKDGSFIYSDIKKIIFNDDNKISVYPNPAKTIVNIGLQRNYKNISLKVYDATGKEVINKMYDNTALINLNIAQLHKGLYYFTITNETENIKGKFMKD